MSALVDPVGGVLGTLVTAQRGLTDAEVELFLATGEVPDLSQSPDEEDEEDEDLEFSPLGDVDARWLLAGQTAIVATFNPDQPRDEDGQWTDGGVGDVADVVGDVVGGMRLATAKDRTAFRERTGKAIPPAWTDVRIAEDLDAAKLLARGTDAKGRAQSIYSAEHTENQAERKFTRVQVLSDHLDKLDHALERDALANDDAAALLLIRRLGMRPGSDKNTGAERQAHGATNLLARHVEVTPGGQVRFSFTGKKGVHIKLETDDPLIAQVVADRLSSRSRDDRLLDTNETRTRAYMRSTGVPPELLLKDLRTLRANVVALREVADRGDEVPNTRAEFRRWRLEVAQRVAAQLGNTPTLALSSYINPTVFSRWVRSKEWL